MKRVERLLKKGYYFCGTMKVASTWDIEQRRQMKRQGYRVDHDFAHTEIPTRTELSQRLLKNGYEDIVFMPAREGNKHRNVDVYCLESISSAAG